MIERVEVFRTKGQTFATAKAAVQYREGLVEELLRKLPGFQSIPAKERIGFVQAVLDNRRTLIDLLDYEVPSDE